MGLHFHVPLPGPFSYTVPVTRRRRRRRSSGSNGCAVAFGIFIAIALAIQCVIWAFDGVVWMLDWWTDDFHWLWSTPLLLLAIGGVSQLIESRKTSK